jgi:hypothetical protein
MMARFPQGFGEHLGLLRREMAFSRSVRDRRRVSKRRVFTRVIWNEIS